MSASSASAQNAYPAYSVPRTIDGHPDLQGNWTNASITTLERDNRYPSTTLNPDEVEALTANHPQIVRIQTEDSANTPKTGLLTGRDLIQGRGYNAFWIDPGSQFGVVRGQTRTAWITDPVDGKIPYSENGRSLVKAANARLGYSDPESRPLPDRCLATGGRTGPPMINGLYNNNYQIVEAPGNVVIYTEMISHARVVPLKDEHSTDAVSPLFGDSIGRWDGDSLVIETTNFHDWHSWQDHPAFLSQHAKVTERLTRVSADEILYEFTVEDPNFYTQPWKGETVWRSTSDKIYEYACHEGNYALEGILSGARYREARGIDPDLGLAGEGEE